MIDWKKFAEEHELSPMAFELEIMKCAAVVGSMAIEREDDRESNTLTYAFDEPEQCIKVSVTIS